MSNSERKTNSPAEGKPKGLSIKQNMLWNSAGSLTYLGLQWLITILVVRLSSSYEAAGVLSLAMTVYNIFSPLAVYRMYTYQVSDIKRENSLGEYASFRIVTCTIALALCAIYALATCPRSSFVAIFLYALFKIASLLIDVLHGEDQLNMRMDYIGKSLMLQGVGTFVAFCGIFVITHSIELAIFGMFVATCIVGVCFDLPRTLRFSPVKIGISRKKVLHLLGYCLPIVIAAIACAVVPSVPRQFLSAFDGEAALGIYASVAAPAAVIQMGASYIYNPLLSIFAEKADSDMQCFKSLFLKTLAGIIGIGVAGVAFYTIFGPWLLRIIFGESIVPYSYLILPVAIMTAVSACLWFINDLLIALRKFSGVLFGNLVALVIALPLSFVLIDLYDMNGVSFTVIAAYIAGLSVMAFSLMRVRKSGAAKNH